MAKKLNIKEWTLLALTVLVIAGAFHSGVGSVWLQVFLSLAVCLGVDALVVKKRTGAYRISESAAITALILASVLAPHEPWWRVLIVSGAAIGSKHLLRTGPRNWFNPAAFGLLVGVFLGSPLGWWAAFSPTLTIALGSALLAAYPGRWKMVASFFLATAAFLAVHALATGAPFVEMMFLVLGSSFFFVFFMMTDPKTTPALRWGMIAFGVIVAFGTALSHAFFPNTIYLAGLLAANACVPLLNKMRK